MIKFMKRPYEKAGYTCANDTGSSKVFKILNGREDERKRLKLVELERELNQKPLSSRPEFQPNSGWIH